MKRRHFIKTYLAAGVSTLVLPMGGCSLLNRNGTLQLAQIGCGRIAGADIKNALAAGWKNEPGKSEALARIVAVCDVDTERARHKQNVAQRFYADKGESNVKIDTYSDHREVLARDDIDGVIISTPEHWHGLIGVAAANAGKHIYIQKPLTYSIPEGKALVRAVRKNQVVLQTGSQQRSSVYFRQICTIVRNKWLGPLKAIEVAVPTDHGTATGTPTDSPANLNYDRWLGPAPEMPYIESRVHPQQGFGRPGWLQVERFCLGMITGWGSHMYDIAQWGVGVDHDSGPVEISATGEFPDRGLFNVHVGYQGEARYANGVRMTSSNGDAGVKFITEEGWAYCARGKMDCSHQELLRRQPTENEVQLYESKNHMGDFIQSAREGSDPICPVEVGHRSNTICVLHHLSMKLGGRRIKWDPERERVIDDPEVENMIQVPLRKPYQLA